MGYTHVEVCRETNMDKHDVDHMNWVFSREDFALTELEKLYYTLETLIRPIRTNRTNHYGLRFKTDQTYMTNDGYLLGSIVWYMRCDVDSVWYTVFGRTPEQTLEKAIELFTAYQELSEKDFDKWVSDFTTTMKNQADDITR